jgi:hypothetical protein
MTRAEACWFFHIEGGAVILRARFESGDGAVGHASDTVHAGETFHGVAYEDLCAAGAGRLVYRRGRWRVVS